MRKTCAVCPTEFEAKRAAAKYCSQRCRKRAQRQPGGVRAARVVPIDPGPPASGVLTAATLTELEQADRIHTSAGQAALALARRIDFGGTDTGSSVAAMVREHRAALAEATRDARRAADPLDELRARRERKLAGG